MPYSAIGDLVLGVYGGLEGWCRYANHPDRRATVELLCNGESVRVCEAVRFRSDQRDLGAGDGYCGFWFILSDEIMLKGQHYVYEAREQEQGTIIGRVTVGRGDTSIEKDLLKECNFTNLLEEKISRQKTTNFASEAFSLLGKALLYKARNSQRGQPIELTIPKACAQEALDVQAADLRWHPNPRVSLIVTADSDTEDLIKRLRLAAYALRRTTSEIIIVDDGSSPLIALLPSRLRGLVVVRTAPCVARGSRMNAAAAVARGDIMAFARLGGPSPADLETVADLPSNTLAFDANLGFHGTERQTHLRHGLDCVVSRADFYSCGGFDPLEDGKSLWIDLFHKASAIGLALKPWVARRAGF